MGLERVTAVLQGVISNYETDLFVPLIQRAAELTGHELPGLRPGRAGQAPAPTQAEATSNAIPSTGRVGTGLRPVQVERSSTESGHKSAASLRVIADHARAATFLISDGVLPSNEGRGYVLRKIIRTSDTHGRLLGQTKPFLHEMVFAVRDLMQRCVPRVERDCAEGLEKWCYRRRQRFAHTLGIG